ncbi:MAG: hypothetical protein GKS05_03865 [Nitrospirales bacterium]|nr:hypothetical protein [Nitrospirales bacterium]
MVSLFLKVMVLVGIFWCGYYVGQQPPETVSRTLKTFSEDVMEKTLGVEKRNLYQQGELLEAKYRIVQSKSELLDGHYRKAGNELRESLVHLKLAIENDPTQTKQSLTERLITRIKGMLKDLDSGDAVSGEQLNKAQRELDQLLDK